MFAHYDQIYTILMPGFGVVGRNLEDRSVHVVEINHIDDFPVTELALLALTAFKRKLDRFQLLQSNTNLELTSAWYPTTSSIMFLTVAC